MISDRIVDQFKQILSWADHFWELLQGYYQKLPYDDIALQVIAITILIIFIITVILSATVVILRTKNTIKAHRLHKLEMSWDKDLMKIIFSEEADSQLSVKIRRYQRQAFLNYLFKYTQRLQGVELERIKTLATPYLPLIVRGIQGGYPELRARHVNILGTFGFPEYIEVIKEALQDKAPIVSMTAAWALARPEYPEHCRIILPVLNLFDQWSMNFLSSMLAGMGPGAAADLRSALSDPVHNSRVRIACAEALNILGDLECADLSAKLLETARDPELQAALLRLLGKVGIDSHRSIVQKHLSSEHYIVRLHALSCLGQLGIAADGELIRNMIIDDSSWVALQAARTLMLLQREDILQEVALLEIPNASLVRQILAEERAA